MSDANSGGGGAPEPELEPQPAAQKEEPRPKLTDQVKRKLFNDDDNILHIAGALVFVSAALIGLLFFFVTGFVENSAADWMRLRSMEVFALIAAVGIVVAIIAKTDNAFVIIFGILLIGALIVPTKDMVSLALLASGQDATYEDGEREYSDGAEFKGRITDLSNKIISRLQEASREPNNTSAERVLDELTPSERGQAVLAVERAISDERKLSHLERARLGGYLPLLLSFEEEDGFQEYYFRHSRENDFVEDLVNLRRQELVSFSYSDFAGAQVTYLGKEIICNYRTSIEKKSECGFADVQQANERDNRQLASSVNPTAEVLSNYCAANVARFSSMNLGDDFQEIVAVPNGWILTRNFDSEFAEGPYGLEVFLNAEEDLVDPVLALYQLEHATNGGGLVCRELFFDDDGGGDLDAYIGYEIFPEGWPGEYVIVAADLDALPGPGASIDPSTMELVLSRFSFGTSFESGLVVEEPQIFSPEESMLEE